MPAVASCGMMNRRGVTLVEVLVAALLLAIGVAGSLSALLASAQLRARASAREAVAQALDARLGWFAARACGFAGDTVVRSAPAARVEESWRVHRDSTVARLEGRAIGGSGPHAFRRALRVVRSCP